MCSKPASQLASQPASTVTYRDGRPCFEERRPDSDDAAVFGRRVYCCVNPGVARVRRGAVRQQAQHAVVHLPRQRFVQRRFAKQVVLHVHLCSCIC